MTSVVRLPWESSGALYLEISTSLKVKEKNMTSCLRVSQHPRGHIAACNARIELVSARAEQCNAPGGDAARMAAIVEATTREEREKREKRLQSFQKEVKERVRKREKSKQLQVTASSEEATLCEQRVAQRAVALDIQVKKFKQPLLTRGSFPDVDDVGITGTRVSYRGKNGQFSVSQLARKALLGQMEGSKEEDTHSGASGLERRKSGPLQVVNQNTGTVPCKHLRQGQTVGLTTVKEPSRTVVTHSNVRFTPVGRLEQAERRQAGEQYLLFRRLYSDLEREQVRQRQVRKSQREVVQRLKREKEAERRIAEDEVTAMESFISAVSSEECEERQRAAEWGEMVALEERKHQLQRMKESERYIDALRRALKDRLSKQHSRLPPLCSCGTSLWDAGPDTCANNCVFYRNPGAYAKALSHLLASLDT